MLFENMTGWRYSFAKSRQLVQNKGQWFLLRGYTVFVLCMAGLYLLALQIQKLTHFNSTLMFMIFSTTAITVANAILTVFYRKRKLARK